MKKSSMRMQSCMFGKKWDRITCYLLVLLVVMMPWQGFAESEEAGGMAFCPAFGPGFLARPDAAE